MKWGLNMTVSEFKTLARNMGLELKVDESYGRAYVGYYNNRPVCEYTSSYKQVQIAREFTFTFNSEIDKRELKITSYLWTSSIKQATEGIKNILPYISEIDLFNKRIEAIKKEKDLTKDFE